MRFISIVKVIICTSTLHQEYTAHVDFVIDFASSVDLIKPAIQDNKLAIQSVHACKTMKRTM